MLFLLGSIIIKNFKSKSFFVSKWRLFLNKKSYLFQTYFELKFLNCCHFEMKKAFDLKIFMMIDLNKDNTQPEFCKVLLIRWKVINFVVICTYRQTDAKRNEIDPWSYDDFGFSWPKEHIHNGLVWVCKHPVVYISNY
jgi:hypothetical protein